MSSHSFAVLFIVTALLSALVTGFVRRYALHRLLDLPNARSSHQIPTPRGGGLAIVLVYFGAVLYLSLAGQLPPDLTLALLGGLPIAAIGFWDDHGHVAARWRFLVQMLAAGWSLYWLGGMESLALAGQIWHPGWFGALFAAWYLVWMSNLFNFMDGIDGIAGVETSTVCLSAVFLTFPHASAVGALPLAGAACGFLAWNWPPARIFMGDVGSGCIGFLLAVLALHGAGEARSGFAIWWILSGVFFLDATWTLLRRMARGERWYEAHRSHAYQHAARRLGAHKPVTLAVLTINLGWLLPLASGAWYWPGRDIWFVVAAYFPLGLLAWRLKAGHA
jgi:Fuc2NAc and GlcNAc transferase